MIYLITGKAGAGKSEYAKRFAQELREEGRKAMVIDGDEFRREKRNTDYTDKGRIKNLTGAAELARELEEQGNVVFVAFVAPRKHWRDMMRAYWYKSRVIYIPGGTLWEGTTYDRPDDDELEVR